MTNYESLENYNDVLSLEETAKYFGASKDTVRKMCVRGELKHSRVGKLYKVTKKNIIEFLEKNN
ncbi:MAG: helix-turn-helix domain-containing protein [Fusobacteriaceae bacterium]